MTTSTIAPVRALPVGRQPRTPLGHLAQAAAALTTIHAHARHIPGLTIPEFAWTATGDLADRPVLVVHVTNPGHAQALASRLGFTGTPVADNAWLWEGTIRGLGVALATGDGAR